MSCIAAAEGHNCANPGAYFYVTHDGGKTWNVTGSDAGGGAMGARMVSKTELKTRMKGKIASFKIPLHFLVVDTFPMTPSGKIRKVELRENALEKLGAP